MKKRRLGLIRGRLIRYALTIFGVMVLTGMMTFPAFSEENTDEIHFDIDEIRVTGNHLIPEGDIMSILKAFQGPDKTVQDVENARATVEALFRKLGYPTVLVNIPEQSVEDGVIDLDVVEGRIRNVKIKGNRYFTMGKIARDLPIFAPGEILYLPEAKEQLFKVNMNPDLKVKPQLMPGKDPGTVDVILDVTDKLPLHGSLEVNNRASANTTDLRVNGIIHYDNLWQREHSLSAQFQTSPEDTDEVQAMSLSYLIHAPWNYRHLLAFYAVFSDSAVAFGDGFLVNGSGEMAGIRYVMPLKGSQSYSHSVTLGIDYKSFDEELYFGSSEEDDTDVDVTPVTYTVLSFVYQLAHMGEGTKTTVNAALNTVLRNMAMDVSEYENKRYKARGNPLIVKLGLENARSLPWHCGMNVKIEGQVTDQPLVSNEQYSAGGMDSVRGYLESEIMGDFAVYSSLEMAFPEVVSLFSSRDQGVEQETGKKILRYKFRPYAFFDLAYATLKKPLSDQEDPGLIQGTGVGFRGYISRHFIYQCDWAWALNTTENIKAGDSRGYFRVKWAF